MKKDFLKNILVVTPALAAISVASYYLYLDYTSNSQNTASSIKREVVAEVTFSSNNVKRKFGDGVLWEPLEKKTILYAKDAIRTGADSYAAIKFNDGSLLEVNENSLIVLDKTTDKLSVDFKVGDITSKGQSKALQIKVNDSVVEGDEAELKFKSGPGNKTDIQVNKGKAVLTGKDRKKIDLALAQKAALDDNGNANVTNLPVILTSPEDKTQIKSSLAELQQTFTWEVTKPEILKERLELSRTDKFLASNTKVFEGHQSIRAPLKQGLHYWRVGWLIEKKTEKGIEKSFEYTESRRIAVESDKRLELAFPENESVLQLEVAENKVDFSWTSQLKEVQYILEVAQTLDFKTLITNQVTPKTTHQHKDFDSGVYYWRVKAMDPKNNVLAETAVYSFQVKVALPPLPALRSPLADSTWETEKPVALVWDKAEKATNYRVLVSSDPQQKEIVKTELVPALQYMWRWKNVGTYYWKVTPLDQNNRIIGQSEVRKFEIKPKVRTPGIVLLNPKDKADIERALKQEIDPVIFQWKATRKMPAPFTFFISKDAEMKQPLKKEDIKVPTFMLRLKEPGIYYWKVVSSVPANVRTPATQTESEQSEMGSFTLKINSNLLPPVLSDPLNKANIIIVEPQPVTFTWKPVEGALQYHFLLERFDPQTKEAQPVLDRMVTETTITSLPLQEGDYTWSVSTVDPLGQSGVPSKTRSFEVTLQPELGAPQLKPAVVK